MSQRDREHLSRLGGLARRRVSRPVPNSVKAARSLRRSRQYQLATTAMQRVRQVLPVTLCVRIQGDYFVNDYGRTLGTGKTARAAWENALTNLLAEKLTA